MHEVSPYSTRTSRYLRVAYAEGIFRRPAAAIEIQSENRVQTGQDKLAAV